MSDKEPNDLPITATLVAENDRMDFLPTAFGPRLYVHGEMAIYDWMTRLCCAYRGGLWDFYTLSNGGFYAAPNGYRAEPLPIVVNGNGYAGTMTTDAAGIVATLFALSQLMGQHPAGTEVDRLVDAYYRLREFALSHREAVKILAAID